MKSVRKLIGLFLKALFSIAFFSVLLSFVQGNELLSVFTNINWFYLLITIAVTIIMVVASCAKWKLVLVLKKADISFWHLFKIYLVGYFFSNILPSTVGGDVVRSYYSGKIINNQSYSAIAIFVERFSGILFLFLLVPTMPLLQPQLYASPYIYIPALGASALLFGSIWMFKAKNPLYIPNRIAALFFKSGKWLVDKTSISFLAAFFAWLEKTYEKVVSQMQRLREEMTIARDALRTDSRFFRDLVLLTVLFYVLTWVNVYTAFKAFNVSVDFLAICAIVPAIMFVAHIPVTLLGNLGYFESVFVFYFLMVGVGGAETLAMGLLLRVKMLGMGLAGFITYVFYKQKHGAGFTGKQQD